MPLAFIVQRRCVREPLWRGPNSECIAFKLQLYVNGSIYRIQQPEEFLILTLTIGLPAAIERSDLLTKQT